MTIASANPKGVDPGAQPSFPSPIAAFDSGLAALGWGPTRPDGCYCHLPVIVIAIVAVTIIVVAYLSLPQLLILVLIFYFQHRLWY